MRRRLAAAAVGAVALAGCGTTLDGPKLERTLKGRLARLTVTASVTCPTGRAVKKGDAFTCRMKAADGSSGEIRVTQKDGKGNVRYDLQVLEHKTVTDGVAGIIETDVKKRQHVTTDVTADCPMIIQRRKDERVSCTASAADGSRLDVDVTQTDGAGHYVVTVK